jgi:hypothetical protein
MCELKTMTDYPADSIGHAQFIFSREDYIILSDPQLDYLQSSYNIATKSFTRFAPKGRGTNELLDVQQLGSYDNDSLFFVKSIFAKDIFIYSFRNASPLFREQISGNGDNVSIFL